MWIEIYSVLAFTYLVKADIFRFANHYAHHMVLQRGPHRSVLWGFGEADTHFQVIVSETNTTSTDIYGDVIRTDWRGLSVWKIVLKSYKSGGPYEIIAIDKNNVSITLKDVLFGDVWLCGGQSNMVFTTGMAMKGHDEIEKASTYRNIRLFSLQRNFSTEILFEIPNSKILQQWSIASKDSVGGKDWQYFSAVCWMFGRRIYDRYQVPIGLISSNYGASLIEAWSSKEMLKTCNADGKGRYPIFCVANSVDVSQNVVLIDVPNVTIVN